MENSYSLFLLVILNILLSVMPGICYGFPTLPDNCTCKTSRGIYSLFSIQRTDGKPRFTVPGSKSKDWSYTYNPCKPYTLKSKKGVCNNLALGRYDTEGDPPVYIDIGEQRDVECEITADGIALVYPIPNKDVPLHKSRVILVCNESYTEPQFFVTDEDELIFSLTSICGCPNRCLPSPATTKAGPSPSTIKTTKAGPSPSTIKTSTSPSSGPEIKDWELVILLPSLAGFLVVAVCFAFLWRKLSCVKEAVTCRCCHCYDEHRDLRREGVTENSALINNQQNNRPVENEDSGAKCKVKEPVQVEEGDAGEEYKPPRKDDMTFVV